MRLESNPHAVRTWSREHRAAGQTIGFVPTMGALHRGHLSLVRAARESGADRVVVSIFVNPTQFAPNEDLDAYPRDLSGDLEKLAELGVDMVFQPAPETIYPDASQTRVFLERLPNRLCGIDRPTHFTGVATVVCLLFNIVEPDVAVFGQKDFQQLMVIRQMARDLWIDVEVVGAPIVRERDGLAMSSRNMYLSEDERNRALSLSRSLREARARAAAGERDAKSLIDGIESRLTAAGVEAIYVRIVHEHTLDDVQRVDEASRVVLAAMVGTTRLIDNCSLLRSASI